MNASHEAVVQIPRLQYREPFQNRTGVVKIFCERVVAMSGEDEKGDPKKRKEAHVHKLIAGVNRVPRSQCQPLAIVDTGGFD
jgi:hypothetical protein